MPNFQVNGQERRFEGDPSMPLMWFLRDEVGLTGIKFGCGVALCGASTLHLGGEAVRACGLQISEVAGKKVVTIEGLGPHGAHPVQVGWRNIGVPPFAPDSLTRSSRRGASAFAACRSVIRSRC